MLRSKGVKFLDNSRYNLCLKIVAVLMAVVLVSGVVFSVLGNTEKNKNDINIITDINSEEKTEFKSVINTRLPENYASLIGVMNVLRSEYSETLKIFTLGYTSKGTAIPMFTMGNGEKMALVISAIHAREHLTTKYILRCIEDYCYAVENGNGMMGNYNIKELLTEYTIYIVPCANPDGLEIVLSRLSVKKDVNVNKLEDYKANYNGVDLNRNFPLAWEHIDNGVTKPAGYFYKGSKPGSEKETQALMSLCENNDFSFLLSVHIKGNCIYWGDQYNEFYNGVYKAFAEDIGSVTGLYVTEPTEKPKNYGGGFENWFRHKYNRPGVCIELVNNINIIDPCTAVNYKNFNKITNYDKTKYALAAAMASQNK